METGTGGKEAESVLRNAATDSSLRLRSDRVDRLYTVLQERMTRKQKTWGDNLTILDGPATSQLPLVLRRARAVERTLLEMPIAIEEDDLIVGNAVEDGIIVRTRLPRYTTDDERARARKEGNRIEVGLSHKTPYYYDVMEKGLSGIMADIDRKIAAIEARPESDEREEKLALFQAMHVECKAVIAMANRHADLAEELSTRASTSRQRDELLKIAQVCRHVPAFAPRTFHEAVQSFWFIHYALFSTQTLISCGRLDQYLYPAFKSELGKGPITLREAQELIDCLWLRFNDRAQICRENFFGDGGGKGDGMPPVYVPPRVRGLAPVLGWHVSRTLSASDTPTSCAGEVRCTRTSTILPVFGPP